MTSHSEKALNHCITIFCKKLKHFEKETLANAKTRHWTKIGPDLVNRQRKTSCWSGLAAWARKFPTAIPRPGAEKNCALGQRLTAVFFYTEPSALVCVLVKTAHSGTLIKISMGKVLNIDNYIRKFVNVWQTSEGGGAALHRVSILASHPAAQGLILCIPKNFSLDVAEFCWQLFLEQWTEAW